MVNRIIFTLLVLIAALAASARHYDFTAQLISTADGLPSNVVIQIWQDDAGYMWFDTRNGVCRYDGYVFQTFARDSVSIPPANMDLLTRDAIWKREGQGRISRRGRDGSVREWQLIPKEIIAYTRNDHFHVTDVDGRTEAISTYGSGLYLYDKPTGELTQLKKDDGPGIIDDNYLTGLFVDRTGCIWVIEDYIGVKCLRINRLQYNMLWLKPDAEIQDANNIRCIAPMDSGRLLVSNQMGDVYTYDSSTGQFAFQYNNSYRVYSAFLDRKNDQWIGTRGNGLWHKGQRVEGLPSPNVFNIRGGGECLLVSMFGGGVARVYQDGRVDSLLKGHHVHDALSLAGRVWVASEEGLFLLNSQGQPLDSLLGCYVCLLVGKDGTLWSGSTDKGLAKVKEQGQRIAYSFYNIKSGLANNGVYAMTEDRTGRIWLGTEEGLSCLEPLTGGIVNYQTTESRLGNVFCERSAVCLPDGRLLFGTHNGMVEIEDGALEAEDAPVSHTSITGLMVNGTNEANFPVASVTLLYTQNNLVFFFSNFQYARQQSVLYQYRLDGVDTEWCQPTTEHTALYRGLPPGHYTFRVRSTAGGGLWGEEASLLIHICQPWWNTWWAWCLYLLTAGILFAIGILAVRRILRLHRHLEVERRGSAFKSDFYDRIERELRNPINVVQGAAENVQLSGTSKTTVQSLRRGSKRMLKLIDMIRQFHQLDEVEMQVRAEEDAMNERAEQRFREIQQSIHAEEAELKELAPPPINEQTILVVESDEDNLTHLADTLNPFFTIVSSQSMADALGLVAKHSFSLVIIDISVDERAGRELTEAILRKHVLLPIVHISAFDDDAHQLRSLRMGAADYIVKPFSGKVLLERITKLIGRTYAANADKQTGSTPQQQELLTNVKDKRFLDLFHSVLESHVRDVNFSVEQFAALMNLGRTQFYKKVKELTGETPAQHLHRARLNYAARLLRNTTDTVEEVMNSAGFNSPTHFYNAFRQQFGRSPREYRMSATED